MVPPAYLAAVNAALASLGAEPVREREYELVASSNRYQRGPHDAANDVIATRRDAAPNSMRNVAIKARAKTAEEEAAALRFPALMERHAAYTRQKKGRRPVGAAA